MVEIEILRNEVPDAALAQRFEREVREAAAGACGSDERLPCAILDEGLHAEIEVELPGWIERVQVPYPARPGEVRRAMTRLLRELGLVDDRLSVRLSGLSRDY